MTQLNFIVPGDPDTKTGGFIYDRRIASELDELDWDVRVIGLDGQFPAADAAAVNSVKETLSSLEAEAVVVMDGLALSSVPELVREHAQRLNIIGLIHHPLGDESGLDDRIRRFYHARENAALSAIHGVVVTSNFTARRLVDLGLVDRGALDDFVQVAKPGVDSAPPAKGSKGAGLHMLCVATVTQRKRHDILLSALAGLSDLDWKLTCVGDYERDDAWASEIFDQVKREKIEDRVSFTGVSSDKALNAAYNKADLFVLASEYEGFGMVFTEALARGVPVVGTTGGAIPGTVPAKAGVLVAPGDASALGKALSRLMGDAEKMKLLKSNALEVRENLETWKQAGQTFDSHLRGFLKQ